ncbi:MAG TPA: hypothetical protein VN732_08675 [Solirubrobacterales bacterium]|nr:hypothetical protein [Solirubrobacterales bacterium]
MVVVLCASLSAVAPASAVPLDRSFGQGGSVSLWSEPDPYSREYARAFATAPDGGIYLLQDRYPCQFRGRTCTLSVSLARLDAAGSRDVTFAGDGQLELPAVQGVSQGMAVDRQGTVLVASYEGGRIVVMRVDANGEVDTSFGAGGRASLPCLCHDADIHVLPQPKGRILAVAMWTINGSGPSSRRTAAVAVYRLRSDGTVDETYGEQGLASARIANATAPDHPTPLPGGGIAFAGEEGYYGGGPWVASLGPRGGFDRRVVRRLRVALRTRLGSKEETGSVGGLVSRPGGRLDLFGGGDARGFVVRIRPDGRLEKRFWRRGLKRLPRPVVRVVATPSGRSFALSPSLERGGFYSIYGLFSTWLDPQDRLLGGFGKGGRAMRYTSAFGQLALQGNSHPLFLDPGRPDEGCRSDCQPSPRLFRFARWR